MPMHPNHALLASQAAENLKHICHKQAVDAGWWNDLQTGEDLRGKRNFGELIALCHSELSEALEGHRKGAMDEHLPYRTSVEVELADAIIRIFDLAGGFGINVAEALVDKLNYNAQRADHRHENRRMAGGKAY